MPKFRLRITRDTTKSAMVEIEAPGIEEAYDIATSINFERKVAN